MRLAALKCALLYKQAATERDLQSEWDSGWNKKVHEYPLNWGVRTELQPNDISQSTTTTEILDGGLGSAEVERIRPTIPGAVGAGLKNVVGVPVQMTAANNVRLHPGITPYAATAVLGAGAGSGIGALANGGKGALYGAGIGAISGPALLYLAHRLKVLRYTQGGQIDIK